MDVQQMAPQQEPKRPSVIWMRVSTSFITFLALLWRLIVWIWGFLIIAAIAGVLGNAAFTYFMTGKMDFQDPRTLTIVAWLSAHFVPCLTILILTLVITLCSYLAHHRKQRTTQENQRVQGESLVVIAKGVQRALGPEHSNLAIRLNNLAILYADQGKYEQAEPLFRRAIAIYQQTFGPDHPGTKTIEGNYARFQEEKKRKRR